MKDPVIIIGMHRSGTSMLTRVLQKSGLFMGHYREKNDESTFFLQINNWLFRQLNCTWDNPMCMEFKNNNFIKKTTSVSVARMESIFILKYLGAYNYLKFRSLRNFEYPWGWKDPRNTFTIDIWKEIFPGAKVLHIYRNPVDVAQSLRLRARKWENSYRENVIKKLKERFLFGKMNYTHSYRVLNLSEGYKLWSEYIEKSLSVNALHMRYEDILLSPEKNIKEIFSYIGLNSEKIDFSNLKNDFRIDRRYAFLGDPELIEFYKSIRGDELLKKTGYENILG